jgi:hypothetical protein
VRYRLQEHRQERLLPIRCRQQSNRIQNVLLQKELSARQIEFAASVREALSAQKYAEKALKNPTPRKKVQPSAEESDKTPAEQEAIEAKTEE